MTIPRPDIETALKELKSYEDGTRFQAVVASLASYKWPHLIASEWHNDLGADMRATPLLSPTGKGTILAASITDNLPGKIKSDAKTARKNFPNTEVFIFVTLQKVSEEKKAKWATNIQKDFGYELIVVSREEIITFLGREENISLCRLIGIPVSVELDTAEIGRSVKESALKLALDRLNQATLKAKPLLSLRSCKLDDIRNETREILQLTDLKEMLKQGRRIVLEAPAGRGKTTTLVQLANQFDAKDGIPFLIDLPAWIMSGKSILEYISLSPHFNGVNSETLKKIHDIDHFAFLLNGWNEISDNFSDQALIALQQLARDFPSSGIIVATRTHCLTPPLPYALHITLLSLNKAERFEYLKNVLDKRADGLRSKLDNDPTLDDLTRTPLILSGVVKIFKSGDLSSIPRTKIAVLDEVTNLMESSSESKEQLKRPPLASHARDYLRGLAIQMTERLETITSAHETLSIISMINDDLKKSGQIYNPPEPQAVLDALCKFHILEKQDNPSTFRFQHHQFQEFFAALRLKSELLTLSLNNDETAIREFTKKYVNQPVWEESLQMIAQEIGNQETGDSEDTDLAKAGILLVQIALNVDPIFAADLARLCGSAVWNHVRTPMSAKLRAWHQSTDPNHRECALAGMLASGSADFSDVIIPQLISEDHQASLTAYRSCDEFHLSILGSDWKKTVSEWSENARIDFVKEVTQNRWRPEIVETFVFNDPSMRVRVAAMEWLGWVGYPEDVAHVIEKLDQETFEATIAKMSPDEIPPAIRSRALTLYQKIYNESTDAVDCLRNLLSQVKLGNTNIEKELKRHLNDLDRSKMKDLGEFVIKPALLIIQKSDEQWTSHWLAERVADGSLWLSHWQSFITSIPEEITESWFDKITNEDLKYQSQSSMNELVAISANDGFIKKIFIKLCELKQIIISSPDQRHEKECAIARQIRDLFKVISSCTAMSGLSKCFQSELNNTEFLVVIDLLNTGDSAQPSCREEIDLESCNRIREYLRSGIDFILEQNDYDGSLKADFANSLSRVGEAEDIEIIKKLIQANLNRCRIGRAARIKGDRTPLGNGGVHTCARRHLEALMRLNPNEADNVIMELLGEPEYEYDSALALVELATIDSKTHSPFGFRVNYNDIWEARAGKATEPFHEERRKKYVSALHKRITELLNPSNQNEDRSAYNIKRLGQTLSALDPKESASLVIEVMLLPGRSDDWCRVQSLEKLLFGGAELPADKILELFELTLQNIRENASHDDRENLLRHFLCVLPFITKPDEGIKKIREVISEFRLLIHVQRDVIDAIGHSRCDEAYSLLRELAGSNGEHIKDLGESWLNALAALKTVESNKLLMSFVDPDITEFQSTPNIDRTDILASHIANLARNDSNIHQRLIGLCDSALPAEERSLLAEAISKLDTEDAIMASLNLIDDTVNPTIPFSLARKFETSFVERRPHEKSDSTFTLAPRSFNSIRKRLFEMSISDGRRKRTAYALLGKIESWRIDYGKPMSEPRHPDFESGEKWPPHV